MGSGDLGALVADAINTFINTLTETQKREGWANALQRENLQKAIYNEVEDWIWDNITMSDSNLILSDLNYNTSRIILPASGITANRTVTFPTLADNQGKRIRLENFNPTYTIIADGEGFETIEGELIWPVGGGYKIFEAQSSEWKIIEDGGKKTKIRITKSNAQVIPYNVWQKVNYDTEVFDELNEYDNSSGYNFTAKEKGVYRISAGLLSVNATWIGTTVWHIALHKNNVLIDTYLRFTQSNTAVNYFHSIGSSLIDCAAGDVLDIRCYQNCFTGGINTYPSTGYNFFEIERIR